MLHSSTSKFIKISCNIIRKQLMPKRMYVNCLGKHQHYITLIQCNDIELTLIECLLNVMSLWEKFNRYNTVSVPWIYAHFKIICSIVCCFNGALNFHGPSMLPDKAKFVVCPIISLALSFWIKDLVIGQLQKPAKFSAFHWSTSRRWAFIGQLLGTSRVVHLPKRTVLVLFTISDA